MLDMGEWLRTTFPQVQDQPIALETLLWRLLLALVLGAGVAAVYRFTQRNGSPDNASFLPTLVLLSVLLAMVTQVIGNSAALAFSLVGILSIVRFRTIVEDTRDTAFVIFAVVVGMAAGVGNLGVAVLGMAIVSLAAFAFHFLRLGDAAPVVEWLLVLRVGTGAQETSAWDALFAKHCSDAYLISTATARQGASLDLTYRLRLKPGVAPLQLLNEINRVEGVQNLELKRG